MQLAAFSLPVGIFLYFSIVGYATLCLLRSKQNPLQNLLLAPAIGIALTLLPVFWLNYAGLPVKYFAVPLAFCLLFLSLFILIFQKPSVPYKQYIPFAGIFLLNLICVGLPLLHFGFNWLSYANNDMANYCLGALRFINHGYTDLPNTTELIQGKDYSLSLIHI